MAYSAFDNNEPKKHYNVRILKFQPNKVLINGRLKDRTELTAEEHRAVQTQEEVDKQREQIRYKFNN